MRQFAFSLSVVTVIGLACRQRAQESHGALLVNDNNARDAATNGKRRVQVSPGISPVTDHISSKFQRLHPLFRVDASTGGTADVARRRPLPEIKHGRQLTGSTSISKTTTDFVEIPTATPAFPGRRVHWRHYRRRPSSISCGDPTWPPTNRKY